MFPKNNEIVLLNSFYPRGLREAEIYNYYLQVKNIIIPEVKNRDLTFFSILKNGEVLVRRKISGGGSIQLTPSNYEKVIHGRLLGIHVSMRRREDYGVIDIDCDNFSLAKEATIRTYDFIIEKVPIVKKANIRFSGKSGFHIICNFGKNIDIDVIRTLLLQSLRNARELSGYTVGFRRKSGIPNLDLSTNKINGNHIIIGSLSLIGLICMEVPYQEIGRFKRHNARIYYKREYFA